MGCIWSHFGTAGIFQAEYISGKFYHRYLHPEANPKERHLIFAGKFNGFYFSFKSSFPESWRHHDAVEAFKSACNGFRLEIFRGNQLEVNLAFAGRRCVCKGFDDGFVGIGKGDIFADKADRHFLGRIFEPAEEILPLLEVRVAPCTHLELAHDALVEFFLFHQEWHIVNRLSVHGLDDAVELDVAEEGKFLFDLDRKRMFGPADKDVRLYTGFEELFDGVLGWFCFEFLGSGKVWNQSQVDDQEIVGADFPLGLTYRFDKGKRFDIPHAATDFCDDDIVFSIFTQFEKVSLDLIRDMGNDLDGLS